MRTLKSVLICIGGSVAITLVSGLVRTPGASLIGGTGYGLPMAWVTRRVLSPVYTFPYFPNATGIIVDLVLWFIILEILYLAAYSLSRGKPAPKARTTRRKR